MKDRALKTAIVVALAILPWATQAQSPRNEKLEQSVAKLRACARMHAPAAQTAELQNAGDAVDFLLKACLPPVTILYEPNWTPNEPGMLALDDVAPANVGAIPPGLFRRVVSEEWAKQTTAR